MERRPSTLRQMDCPIEGESIVGELKLFYRLNKGSMTGL